MAHLKSSYEAYVRANPAKILALEKSLNALSYVVPDKYGDKGDLFAESLASLAGLLGTYHEHIHGLRSSESSPALYNLKLALSCLAEVELPLEIACYALTASRNPQIRFRCIATIEFLRLLGELTLIYHGSCDALEEEDEEEGSQISAEPSPSPVVKGSRTGRNFRSMATADSSASSPQPSAFDDSDAASSVAVRYDWRQECRAVLKVCTPACYALLAARESHGHFAVTPLLSTVAIDVLSWLLGRRVGPSIRWGRGEVRYLLSLLLQPAMYFAFTRKLLLVLLSKLPPQLMRYIVVYLDYQAYFHYNARATA